VLDAVGSVYLEIEAMLSQGLPNTPMANSRIRVIGGNFITGQPIGVLDGIDMHYAGKVRKVDAEGINAQLGLGNIVLLNCEGPSPTGEIFNLQMEEAAEAVAVAIKADKLVYLTDSNGVTDQAANCSMR
jgi:amino-acid N-acetyltransferase